MFALDLLLNFISLYAVKQNIFLSLFLSSFVTESIISLQCCD